MNQPATMVPIFSIQSFSSCKLCKSLFKSSNFPVNFDSKIHHLLKSLRFSKALHTRYLRIPIMASQEIPLFIFITTSECTCTFVNEQKPKNM